MQRTLISVLVELIVIYRFIIKVLIVYIDLCAKKREKIYSKYLVMKSSKIILLFTCNLPVHKIANVFLFSLYDLNKGPFKYYVIKEVGGWRQKMAIFDDLQYCKM